MTNYKKGIVWLTLLIVGLSLLVCGCGGKKQVTTGKQVEIRLGFPSAASDDYKLMKDQVIPMFEKLHPDIKIKFEYMPWNQFRTKLLTQLAAGEAPDFWLCDGVQFMDYASRGAIKDLTEYVNRDFDKDEFFALDFPSDPNGRIWGVVRDIQTVVLYYNKELFNEVGLKYPDETWNWDSLLAAAKKLTKKQGRNNQYGFYSQNWITAGWFNFIYQNKGRILDETRTKSMLNQPEAIEAVQFMVDMIHKYKVAPTDEAISGVGTLGGAFPANLVAMQYHNSLQASVYNQIKDLDYDVSVLPKGKIRAVSYNANPFVINAKSSSEKAKAAWEFIKFFARTEDVQKLLAEGGYGIPILKKVVYSRSFVDSQNKPDNKMAFIEPLEKGYGLPMDLNKCWGEWRKAVDQNLSLAWMGEITAEKAMLKAHKEVQEILDTAFAKKD